MAALSDSPLARVVELRHLRGGDLDQLLEEETQAWRETLEAAGLKWSFAEVKKIMKAMNLTPEVRAARGLTIGMALGLGGIGKGLAKNIKTQEQFEKALQQINRAGEQMPTMIRKATKELARSLPRRGGPGRQPKLTPKESAQMCDQIALYIRQKHNLKEALQKVAELTPTLLGKKVGARTLQKAWDKRGELVNE